MLRVVILLFYGSLGSTIFEKKSGFNQDHAHDRLFRKIDVNGDGYISRAELLSSTRITGTIFDYQLSRRVAYEAKNGGAEDLQVPVDNITYKEFMWLYRESWLFESRGLMPPDPPAQLYSFPTWPGQRSAPIKEEVSDFLTPQRFWEEYVFGHKSVIIRNAMEGSRAMRDWSDPNYLVSSFGDLEAKIEPRLESRGDASVKKPAIKSRATVREIVQGTVDGYVVSVVPQAMAWDVKVPKCMLCGRRERPYLDISSSKKYDFITELEETSLWISRGKTRSQLHYDKENTLNCLVSSGKPKEWLLLDTRKYHSVLPWVRGGGYSGTNDMWNKYTDWIGVDVENLDLNLHKYLLEVQFEVVTQNPGDCIFLPYSMLHYAAHLAEADSLQVAVSYMWLPETAFTPCPVPPLSLPLAVFDTVWYFSGFGSVPQGNQDPRAIERAILDHSNNSSFNAEGILSFMAPGGSETGIQEIILLLKTAEILFRRNVSIPLDLWLQLSAAADLNSLGCNEGTSYHPRPLEEIDRMFAYLENATYLSS